MIPYSTWEFFIVAAEVYLYHHRFWGNLYVDFDSKLIYELLSLHLEKIRYSPPSAFCYFTRKVTLWSIIQSHAMRVLQKRWWYKLAWAITMQFFRKVKKNYLIRANVFWLYFMYSFFLLLSCGQSRPTSYLRWESIVPYYILFVAKPIVDIDFNKYIYETMHKSVFFFYQILTNENRHSVNYCEPMVMFFLINLKYSD